MPMPYRFNYVLETALNLSDPTGRNGTWPSTTPQRSRSW